MDPTIDVYPPGPACLFVSTMGGGGPTRACLLGVLSERDGPRGQAGRQAGGRLDWPGGDGARACSRRRGPRAGLGGGGTTHGTGKGRTRQNAYRGGHAWAQEAIAYHLTVSNNSNYSITYGVHSCVSLDEQHHSTCILSNN